jgi:transcriptional regulator with XRE-family HTH domain
MDVVQGLLTAKGLTRTDFATQLEFSGPQVASWFSTSRRPTTLDSFRIADSLEVPPQFLFGLATNYDGIEIWKVAAKSSLDHFLTTRRDVPGEIQQLFSDYTEFSSAPRRSAHWLELYENLFLPALRLSGRQNRRLQEMWKRPTRGV